MSEAHLIRLMWLETGIPAGLNGQQSKNELRGTAYLRVVSSLRRNVKREELIGDFAIIGGLLAHFPG